jgi:predicted permease
VTATKLFKLPSWVTPAFAFNNTTSLPLLLVQSLDAAGILSSLDSSSDVVDRAKSYFLVNAMISNSFTFALGPKFLDCPDDIEASDTPKDPLNDAQDASDLEDQQEEAVHANEETSLLLPQRAARDATTYQYGIIARCQTAFASLPTFLQQTLSYLSLFINPPCIGTCLGALIGLVPALHTLFFSDQQHGGYLNAWLTAALQNVGDLFAALQVIVVGIKLSSSLLKWKKGEASGNMPWGPWATVTFVRFVLWPAISIPLIYAFATKTGVLDDEPILWFAMMLMPVGPPALSITAMADVSGADETQKLSIAKFLTVSYVVSPLICFSVVGALKASQAAAS